MDSFEQSLTLLQLSDSFFPSGSYTLSHGLESLVQSQQVTTAVQVEEFARLLIVNRMAGVDLVAIAHTHRASQRNQLIRLTQLDAILTAQTPIERSRIAQRNGGRALLMVAQKTWPHAQLTHLSEQDRKSEIQCLHPIVFAVVGQIAGLSEAQTLMSYGHGLVTGVLSAAIRLSVIGHGQAQQIRQRLNPALADACREAQQTDVEDMWSCTPLIDWAQMRQAKLSRRLFAS